jgi:citrate synthase
LSDKSPGMEDGRASTATGAESLTVKDNRTGKSYDIEITDGTVRAMDFRGSRSTRTTLV